MELHGTEPGTSPVWVAGLGMWKLAELTDRIALTEGEIRSDEIHPNNFIWTKFIWTEGVWTDLFVKNFVRTDCFEGGLTDSSESKPYK